MIEGKLAGVLSGAFLALVFIPPKTISGFLRRGSAALVFGWVFGHLVLHYTSWELTPQNELAGFALASFLSWWVMGAWRRAVDRFTWPGEK